MSKIFGIIAALSAIIAFILSDDEFSRSCEMPLIEYFYGSVELAFLSVLCFTIMGAYLACKILEDLFD